MVISWDLLASANGNSEIRLSAPVLVDHQCMGHGRPGGGGAFWAVGEAAVRALPSYPFPGSKQLAGLQLALTSLDFKEESHCHQDRLHTQVRGRRTRTDPEVVAGV